MFQFAKRLSVVFFLVAGMFLLAGKVNAQIPEFDPAYIISDSEILDHTSMTLADVKSFLAAKGGYLANYSCPDADGQVLSAAEIIYNAAANNHNYDCDGVTDLSPNPTDAEKAKKCLKVVINPKFLIVLLQKEQSLIDDPDPSLSQLDWATGYGCYDGQSCNTRWKGFGKQVNSAAMQFFSYMVHPEYYKYKANNTYNFTNPYSAYQTGPSTVTPLNQATAALYNYTPHVYNGNYNFHKIWMRWFTRMYPDGTLLKAKDSKAVWLVQGGKKRQFASMSVVLSRYDLSKILTVNQSDIDSYDTGPLIKFPQYSLVKSPKGTIFLIVDDTRHGIASKDAFRKIGFNSAEIINGGWDDINAYKEGTIITATTTYPVGALLQDKKTGGIFWVIDGKKAPLLDKVFLKTKFKNKKIKGVTAKELDKYQKTDPIMFEDGELLKSPVDSGVYIIDKGQKRLFASGEIFEALGYDWDNVISVPAKILDLYSLGEPVVIINREENVITVPAGGNASSTATSTPGTASTTPGALISSSTPGIISTSTVLNPNIFGTVPTGTIISASSTLYNR